VRALAIAWSKIFVMPIAIFQALSLPGLTGQSSNPYTTDVSRTSPYLESGGYWIARSSRAMTSN
jgi:hypothetical protein